MPPSRTERIRRRVFVAWLKGRYPTCGDCGLDYPSHLLEFAHLRRDGKSDHVACIVRDGSTERLLQEIARCRLLCKNCHGEETHQQRRPTKSRRRPKAPWTIDGLRELLEKCEEEAA